MAIQTLDQKKDRQETHPQYIYSFGGNAPTPPLDKNLLGGKGKGLAEMCSIGLPVPPGFIITSQACNDYRKLGKQLPEGLKESVIDSMKILQKLMGAEFGS